MKRIFIAFLLLAFTGYAQENDVQREVALGEAFTIKIGEQVSVKATNLKITFIVVTEDSRCPEDVVCGWPGNARLKFKLKAKEKAKTVFNTTFGPREGDFRGYKIKLIELAPNRRAGQPIPQNFYSATLIVTN